jgi:hypothetical protein
MGHFSNLVKIAIAISESPKTRLFILFYYPAFFYHRNCVCWILHETILRGEYGTELDFIATLHSKTALEHYGHHNFHFLGHFRNFRFLGPLEYWIRCLDIGFEMS